MLYKHTDQLLVWIQVSSILYTSSEGKAQTLDIKRLLSLDIFSWTRIAAEPGSGACYMCKHNWCFSPTMGADKPRAHGTAWVRPPAAGDSQCRLKTGQGKRREKRG